MANTGYDPRLVEVEEERETALKNTDRMYEDLITQTKDSYDRLIAREEAYRLDQTQAQQEETDLEIEKLQQEQEAAQADYAQEQSDAYTDYQTQVNPYGVTAEKIAGAGMSGSGYSESAKVSMYNAYQNRVAVARQGFEQAVREYDLAIREARQLNSAALAKIAYDTLKRQAELSLKAATQYAQLQQKWEDHRQDQEEYFRKWEEEVLQQIQENPSPGGADPNRLPDTPDADTKRWAI